MDETTNMSNLKILANVKERPEKPDVAESGSLIERFLWWWNSKATRWYALPMVQQQNAFNNQLVALLNETSQQLLIQDRELTQYKNRVAQLTTELTQLNNRFRSLDNRLKKLEAARRQDHAG